MSNKTNRGFVFDPKRGFPTFGLDRKTIALFDRLVSELFGDVESDKTLATAHDVQRRLFALSPFTIEQILEDPVSKELLETVNCKSHNQRTCLGALVDALTTTALGKSSVKLIAELIVPAEQYTLKNDIERSSVQNTYVFQVPALDVHFSIAKANLLGAIDDVKGKINLSDLRSIVTNSDKSVKLLTGNVAHSKHSPNEPLDRVYHMYSVVAIAKRLAKEIGCELGPVFFPYRIDQLPAIVKHSHTKLKQKRA